jgi:hypothetical protein
LLKEPTAFTNNVSVNSFPKTVLPKTVKLFERIEFPNTSNPLSTFNTPP